MRLKILFFPLSIILALVIFIWMIKPEWDERGENKIALDKVETQLANLNMKIQSIGKSLNEYNGLTIDRELVMNAIPYEYNDEEFLSEIYEKVKNEKLLITKLDLEKKKPSLVCARKAEVSAEEVESMGEGEVSEPVQICTIPLLERDVTIEVEGDYINVRNFITAIEKMNRLFTYDSYKISKLNLSAGEGANPSSVVMASVDFVIFSKPLDEKLDIAERLDPPNNVMKKLLNGKLDLAVVDKFKTTIANVPYPGLTVQEPVGKENIFAGE